MKGYASLGIGKHGWIEKETPKIGPLDALLRPVAIAPCTSDVHSMHGGAGELKDVILGHEALGEVVEVGSLVKKFKKGDIVVVPCTTPNWEEPNLQRRHSNNAHDAGLMGSFKFMLSQDGVFAEFFRVINADANLVLMPEGVSVEDALMTCDMMSTGFYAAEQAEIQIGDSVVVFGIGPIGLMAIAGAKSYGAGRIIAVDARPTCEPLAREYGATDIVSFKEGDVVEKILALEGQVDHVILAGGNASTINQALLLTRPNGVVVNINYQDGSDTYHIPTWNWGLGMSDVSIKCGFCPGGAYRMERMLNMVKYGRVHPGKLLTHKFEGFDKIKDAFIMMDEKPKDMIKPYTIIKW